MHFSAILKVSPLFRIICLCVANLKDKNTGLCIIITKEQISNVSRSLSIFIFFGLFYLFILRILNLY